MWGSLGLAAWLMACRWVPGLAEKWHLAVALPALRALHRASSAFPFPLLEPLALAVPIIALVRRRMARVLLVVAGIYALLWYPAYWAKAPEVFPVADAAALETLCGDLTDRLKGPAPDLDGTAEALPVKLARYPEWMSALGIAGLFSPWTGEALADPEAAPEALPFTCIHELAHLEGIADEGAANVAAWQECQRRGGAYLYSARLWALRYALQRLSDADPEACRRALSRVDPKLVRLLAPLPVPAPGPLARLLGIGEMTLDYGILVDFLACSGLA